MGNGLRAKHGGPRGRTAGTGGPPDAACLWRAKASKRKREAAASAAAEVGGVQASLSWVMEGHRRAVTSLLMPKSAAVFTVHLSRVTGLVATGGADGTVRIWDSGAPVGGHVLIETGHPIHSVRFSVDGSMLAAGGNDKQVRIWALGQDPAAARQLPGTWKHQGYVRGLAWSADGTPSPRPAAPVM
jgi:WD40 repeat protein